MLGSPSSVPTHQQVARRPCPRCGWDMSVASTKPKKLGHTERAPKCPMCEHFEGPQSNVEEPFRLEASSFKWFNGNRT
jgi:predicted RNA-binding Zn-ribbon protein involved in translation (DUF1610 family)